MRPASMLGRSTAATLTFSSQPPTFPEQAGVISIMIQAKQLVT